MANAQEDAPSMNDLNESCERSPKRARKEAPMDAELQKEEKEEPKAGGSELQEEPPSSALKRARSDEPEPSSPKRARLAEPGELDWKIRFSQSAAMKSFCENIGNILHETCFEVLDGEGFSGLSVESIDSARSCLVQARLSGQVTLRDPGARGFCVRMASLISCLRSAHACHFLDMWQLLGDTDVICRVYEPNVSNYTPEFRIRTLAKQADPPRLQPLTYAIFVEIDLETFRSAVKTAKEHRADSVQISVFTPKAGLAPREGAITTFFVVAYEGDEVSSRFVYQSCTQSEGGEEPMVIHANDAGGPLGFERLPDAEDLNQLFSSSFSTDNLVLFVRSMERHVLTLRLGEGKPLLLEFPMGGGTDYIRYVLAPKIVG